MYMNMNIIYKYKVFLTISNMMLFNNLYHAYVDEI